jgi:hypothetical protein|tara:strand:+ start:1935 stop:2303 length:369 start_codon:yes stop_codon:yes gene_type:complete
MGTPFKMKGYSYPGQSPGVPKKTDPPVLRSELDDKGKKLYDSKNKTKKYNMEEAQTADNSGPVKPINKTVASNTRVNAQSELINDLEDKIEYINTDIENDKVSEAEGKKTIAGYRAKLAKLR